MKRALTTSLAKSQSRYISKKLAKSMNTATKDFANDDDDDDDENSVAQGKEESSEDHGASTVVQFIASSSSTEEQENDEEITTMKKLLPAVDLPLSTTTIELQQILNRFLENNEQVPYAFYVSKEQDEDSKELAVTLEREVTGTIKEALAMLPESHSASETTLRIRYQPLSLFKVHPVTRCTQDLPGHTEAILHVSFSPDGSDLASGGGDTTVRFWDIFTNTPRHVCRGHTQHVLCTAWSPDGKRFASGDKTGEIRVWNPKTGKQEGKAFIGHKKWVTSLSWEPMHVNESCERFISGSKDGTARVWNARTGRCEMTLTGHSDSVECVLWGGEGLIYTASRDKTIMVWSQRDEHATTSGSDASAPFKLARKLTGHAHRINFLAISNGYICRTGCFDPASEFSLARAKKRKDGASNEPSPTVSAIERYNKAKIANGTAVPFERLVSCSDDYTLFLWFPTENKHHVSRMTGHVQPVTHISFSPDGRFVASASFDKKVRLWDGRSGSFLATLNGHVGSVYQVCWSADSRLLASASKDSTIKVWEARNPKKAIHTLSGHLDEVYALDWSPDGQILASGSKDRIVKIWKN